MPSPLVRPLILTLRPFLRSTDMRMFLTALSLTFALENFTPVGLSVSLPVSAIGLGSGLPGRMKGTSRNSGYSP